MYIRNFERRLSERNDVIDLSYLVHPVRPAKSFQPPAPPSDPPGPTADRVTL